MESLIAAIIVLIIILACSCRSSQVVVNDDVLTGTITTVVGNNVFERPMRKININGVWNSSEGTMYSRMTPVNVVIAQFGDVETDFAFVERSINDYYYEDLHSNMRLIAIDDNTVVVASKILGETDYTIRYFKR